MALMLLLVGAVLVNGFVCGALSGPFARYQARITWLVAAGAAIATLSLVPQLAQLARWLWSRPPVQAVARRLDPAFPKFFLVGAVGFSVDALVLHAMTGGFQLSPFVGRLVSFPVAVLATWLLNRSFTFRHETVHTPVRQALVYFGVQVTGGVANIGVYSLALTLAPTLKSMLLVPLALGSIAGLCLTFLGSKHIAFKPAPPVDAAPAAEAVEAPAVSAE
jgi:putative flippase GtrA